MCPGAAAPAVNKQISAASLGLTKYRRTSRGTASGCRRARRYRKPCNRLPLEKATLAKRVEVTKESLLPIENNTCSMRRLLAPMRLVGFAALSVETAK